MQCTDYEIDEKKQIRRNMTEGQSSSQKQLSLIISTECMRSGRKVGRSSEHSIWNSETSFATDKTVA